MAGSFSWQEEEAMDEPEEKPEARSSRCHLVWFPDFSTGFVPFVDSAQTGMIDAVLPPKATLAQRDPLHLQFSFWVSISGISFWAPFFGFSPRDFLLACFFWSHRAHWARRRRRGSG